MVKTSLAYFLCQFDAKYAEQSYEKEVTLARMRIHLGESQESRWGWNVWTCFRIILNDAGTNDVTYEVGWGCWGRAGKMD